MLAAVGEGVLKFILEVGGNHCWVVRLILWDLVPFYWAWKSYNNTQKEES